MTKNNKPMGFITLEDIQGSLELVVFPRLWEKYVGLLRVGQVVVVNGKVDAQSMPPKILVDAIQTSLEPPARPAENPTAPTPPPAEPTLSPEKPAPGKPHATYAPPPPENFPPDWEREWQPSFENAAVAARAEALPPGAEGKPSVQVETAGARPQEMESPPPQPKLPPSLYIPLAREADAKHPPKQITITLRPIGDKEHDKRRFKTVYGTLISFHGHDRFSFHIFENGKGHLIDFPNETTRICPELLERLKKLIGEECWQVEEITFQ